MLIDRTRREKEETETKKQVTRWATHNTHRDEQKGRRETKNLLYPIVEPGIVWEADSEQNIRPTYTSHQQQQRRRRVSLLPLYTKWKRETRKKGRIFSPLLLCLSLTQGQGRAERIPTRPGRLSLSLWRGEWKRASARGVCQFVKTVRRSGTSTPTDADVADAISSLSLFSNSIDSKHLLVSSKTRALCYISQKSAQDWARDFNPLFLRPVILYTKSSWIFFSFGLPISSRQANAMINQ